MTAAEPTDALNIRAGYAFIPWRQMLPVTALFILPVTFGIFLGAPKGLSSVWGFWLSGLGCS